jgi:hypothetical protein
MVVVLFVVINPLVSKCDSEQFSATANEFLPVAAVVGIWYLSIQYLLIQGHGLF